MPQGLRARQGVVYATIGDAWGVKTPETHRGDLGQFAPVRLCYTSSHHDCGGWLLGRAAHSSSVSLPGVASAISSAIGLPCS